jgi:hypothetical protein
MEKEFVWARKLLASATLWHGCRTVRPPTLCALIVTGIQSAYWTIVTHQETH